VTRANRYPAFTLIELLVVISVISVLISILTPTLAASRESARRVICLNNLRSLGLAIQMYQDDHDRALPYAKYSYALPLGWTEPIDALGPYLDVDLPSIDKYGDIVSDQPFCCPSDPGYCDQFGISYFYFPAPMDVATPVWSEQAIAKHTTMSMYERGEVARGGAGRAIFSDASIWHSGGPNREFESDGLVGRNSLRYDGSVGWSVDDGP